MYIGHVDENDQRALDLLRQLDRESGPDMEFPDGFDYHRDEERATALAARLERDFGRPCLLGGMQDAASTFTVSVSGSPIMVWLSNFGDLASISPPSCFPEHGAGGVAEGSISDSDRLVLEAALSDLGYVVVPERPLKLAYDGIHTDWMWVGEPNWFVRFFYHL